MGTNTIDKQLVMAAKNGDKEAFNALVLKYQHKIAKLVSRFIQNPAEVLDVTQDAFIKAYKALPNFRGESAFYTWMYRIAINTAKNHIMQMERRPPDTDIDVEDAEVFMASKSKLREYNTPEHLLMRDEIEEKVFSALEALPEDLKKAIILREIEGYSYEAISEEMHCPVGTVRSRIFRAREAIDKQLHWLLKGG